MSGKVTYKDAGVNVEAGDQFISRIKKMIGTTYNKNVVTGVGGFAALYDLGDRYLASGTDGVGTKLKLAQELGIHHSIGVDLVAMCVNDILCTGATPLFFLDYIATGKLDVEVGEQIVEGIVDGCMQSGCALVGGETAEMPGMYKEGEYDLAGFAVGDLQKDQLLDGTQVKEGDYIIGLPSSGFHSNGYSLIRKLIKDDEKDLKEACLTPTKIYVKKIKELMRNHPGDIKGLAHITGGGFANIRRINEKYKYRVVDTSFFDKMPDEMKEITKRSGLSEMELMSTFNMGVGMVIITGNKDLIDNGYLLGKVESN